MGRLDSISYLDCDGKPGLCLNSHALLNAVAGLDGPGTWAALPAEGSSPATVPSTVLLTPALLTPALLYYYCYFLLLLFSHYYISLLLFFFSCNCTFCYCTFCYLLLTAIALIAE